MTNLQVTYDVPHLIEMDEEQLQIVLDQAWQDLSVEEREVAKEELINEMASYRQGYTDDALAVSEEVAVTQTDDDLLMQLEIAISVVENYGLEEEVPTGTVNSLNPQAIGDLELLGQTEEILLQGTLDEVVTINPESQQFWSLLAYNPEEDFISFKVQDEMGGESVMTFKHAGLAQFQFGKNAINEDQIAEFQAAWPPELLGRSTWDGMPLANNPNLPVLPPKIDEDVQEEVDEIEESANTKETTETSN